MYKPVEYISSEKDDTQRKFKNLSRCHIFMMLIGIFLPIRNAHAYSCCRDISLYLLNIYRLKFIDHKNIVIDIILVYAYLFKNIINGMLVLRI